MGAKAGILVYADGTVADALKGVSSWRRRRIFRRRATGGEAGRAAELVARVRPGHGVEPDGVERWDLGSALCPPEGTVCALSVPGLDLVCDQSIMVDRPSELPGHLIDAGRGRRMYVFAMHSVVDWTAFAVWDDGHLVRSLSVAGEDGVMEDIGERFPFEVPYWEGRYPVDSGTAWEDDDWEDDREDPYPLGFHPLELGERAMLALFGFCVEGTREENEPEPVVDIWKLPVHGFHATPPQ
jgi:hypothetical protein